MPMIAYTLLVGVIAGPGCYRLPLAYCAVSQPVVFLAAGTSITIPCSIHRRAVNVLQGIDPDTPLHQFAELRYCRVSEDMVVFDVFARLRSEHCRIALAMEGSATGDAPDTLTGVLSWADILEAANLPHNMRPVKDIK